MARKVKNKEPGQRRIGPPPAELVTAEEVELFDPLGEDVLQPDETPEGVDYGKREYSPKEKQRQAHMLRMAGVSYGQIADMLGYASPAAARGAAMAACSEQLNDTPLQLKHLQHARLEHILMLWWPDVNRKDPSATALVMGVLDRMERLHTLSAVPFSAEEIDDARKKVGVLTIGGTEEDYINGLRALAEG